VRVLLLGLVLLASCAPRQQAVQTSTLPPEQTRALIQRFAGELRVRGITLTAASGQAVTPPSAEGLLSVVKGFSSAHLGFCALAEAPFVADAEQLRFMTISSLGADIRVLIYDRSDATKLLAVTASGTATTPLPARACQLAG
jgi:hypothetical protein